jgi:uncharacterized membrane protein YjfL (UPF0719 family)
MFATRLLVSLFEFGLAVVMSGFVIFLTYRTFIHANPDFDMEQEIKKGNVAVGLLVGTILISASMMLQRGMESVVGMFRLWVSAPAESNLPFWQLCVLSVGHLTMSMFLAVLTISTTLRMFGRLTSHLQEGKELQKGNMAIGILLSSVVLVACLYVGEGVSALSKALVPQPKVGRVLMMR